MNVTFSGYGGGRFDFTGGENINAGYNVWARMVEAPIARNALVNFDGINHPENVSSVSFMLNQLSITSDRSLGEVVAPTDASWAAQGLDSSYYDFSKKRILRYRYGLEQNAIAVTPINP